MSAPAPKGVPGTRDPGNVAVIGGGIGGLAAAHYLAAAGARITLYEASDQLGGLGTFFPYRDVHLERHYHCLVPSDRHLLALLRDLGLEEQTYWKETSFGFMRDGRLYELNSPLDLLRFGVLPVIDRLRIGVTGLWGRWRGSRGLDDVTCVEWLGRLSGRRAFEAFWKPMLQAKFGERYQDVPALWFWTRFNREKGGGRERKGYIHGGYRRIAQQLAASITQMGGQIELRTAVDGFDLGDDGRPTLRIGGESRAFDRAVCTAPLPLLRQFTAGGALEPIVGRIDSTIDMQGVVNGVFMLKRGLSGHYWVAAIDDEIPFQGVIESTSLLELADTAGVHLVYVMNYVHRTDPWYLKSDAEVLAAYGAGLKRLFPELRDEDFVDRFVFRSAYVEPLYTRGYLRRRPPTVLVPGRVYLATTTQVYPEVTSWNGATGLARAVVAELLAQA
jgi:protoporphyrinogen oxidase